MRLGARRNHDDGQALEILIASDGVHEGGNDNIRIQKLSSGLIGIPLNATITMGVDEATGERMLIIKLTAAQNPPSLTPSPHKDGEYLN